MLFLKELKKVCFSLTYIVFAGLLLFSWHENFYGVTAKEISAAAGGDHSITSRVTGGSVLEKPEKNADSYGMKKKEVPEKIMSGGTDMLIMEYLANSYAAYPFTYYKEVILSKKDQNKILEIICEITGLTEQEIHKLPDDYFPSVNGNIIHMGSDMKREADSLTIEMDGNDSPEDKNDYKRHFISQVSYERFQELMKEAEEIIGNGSSYSMDMLLEYYGQEEMTYDEAMEEYDKTIYEDKVSTAFARLFCDYMSRALGLYPVFIAAAFWLKDKRNRMDELVNCKKTGTAKLLITRTLAILTAVMLPVILLSFESLIPLINYSADTGIVIDPFAFIKYILWWLLPAVMAVTASGMFLTILTSAPTAVLVQFIWWFTDNSITELSGGTNLYTLMIRHNTLNGSELIQEDFLIIWLNRGLLVLLSFILIWLSIVIYQNKRGGKLSYDYLLQKHLGIYKDRFWAHFQK